MASKQQRLETTVAAIQNRWGVKALRRLDSVTEEAIPHIPTGFPALDEALKIGGVPRGRLTELLGAPTSGVSTLALKIVANAQEDGDTAAYVDLSRSFDADYAARCGVHLDRTVLVRPTGGREALEITHALVARGGTGVLVFDAVSELLAEPHESRTASTIIRRLAAALSGSVCALIFLTPLPLGSAVSTAGYPDGFLLPYYAAVRLLIEKERWLLKRRDVVGYRARASVVKNDFGPPGKSASIAITFSAVVRGDCT